jgi:hypothetical protein
VTKSAELVLLYQPHQFSDAAPAVVRTDRGEADEAVRILRNHFGDDRITGTQLPDFGTGAIHQGG